MRRLTIPTIIGAALAGCASTAPLSFLDVSLPPPPIEGFLAPYQSGGLCNVTQDYLTSSPSAADPRTRPIRHCPPVYPDALQRRDYEATCRVRFQITKAGEALSPAATCNVWSGRQDNTPEWTAFALTAFTALAEMSVGQSLFPPADDTGDDRGDDGGDDGGEETVFERGVAFELQ